jgi:hypothetical protein
MVFFRRPERLKSISGISFRKRGSLQANGTKNANSVKLILGVGEIQVRIRGARGKGLAGFSLTGLRFDRAKFDHLDKRRPNDVPVKIPPARGAKDRKGRAQRKIRNQNFACPQPPAPSALAESG